MPWSVITAPKCHALLSSHPHPTVLATYLKLFGCLVIGFKKENKRKMMKNELCDLYCLDTQDGKQTEKNKVHYSIHD